MVSNSVWCTDFLTSSIIAHINKEVWGGLCKFLQAAPCLLPPLGQQRLAFVVVVFYRVLSMGSSVRSQLEHSIFSDAEWRLPLYKDWVFWVCKEYWLFPTVPSGPAVLGFNQHCTAGGRSMNITTGWFAISAPLH